MTFRANATGSAQERNPLSRGGVRGQTSRRRPDIRDRCLIDWMRSLRELAAVSIMALVLQQTAAGHVSSPSLPSTQTRPPASQPARDTPVRNAGTGVIRGRVIVDGSVPPTPISGVRVSISGVPGIEPIFTDGAGRFELTALLAGRYVLTAEKTGFVKTRYGAKSELDQPVPVQVSDDASVSNVQIGMPKGAAITGRIVDDLGDPVVGAVVTVGFLRIAGRDPNVIAVSPRLGWTTDDRGEYRIGGLSAGRYVLLVHGATEGSPPSGPPEWRRTIGWATTYYPDAASPATATPIALRAGEERAGVDFRLVPSRPPKLTLSLTDQSGSPITGVILLVQPAISGAQATAAVSPANPTTTLTLQPGEWIASLIGGGSGRALAHLALGSGEETSLALVAGPGARMSGRVVFRGAAAPPALGGVGLRVRGVGPDARSPFSSAPTVVKADGTFEITGLLGTIVLQPASPIPGWTLQAVTAGTRDLLDEPLALTGNERITDVEVVFTDRLAELSGSAVDERGRSSPGCSVVLLPERGDLRADGDRARLQRADQHGRFIVNDMRPGTYLAAAIANLDASEWLSAEYRERLRPVALLVTLAEHDKKPATLVCSSLP